MSNLLGSYWLVQYRPSPRREEAVNIGVVLSVEDAGFLDWRFDPQAKVRVNRAFPGHRVKERAHLQTSSVEAHFRRLREAGDCGALADRVEALAAKLANEVRVGKTHRLRLTTPNEELERLFTDLVLRKKPEKKGPGRIDHQLGALLKQQQLDDYVERDVPIEVPLWGAAARTMQFSYAYQNGSYNVVRAERLDASSSDRFLKTTSFYRETSRALVQVKYRTLPVKLILYVDSEDPDSIQQLGNVVENATIVCASEPEVLIEDIRKAKLHHGAED